MDMTQEQIEKEFARQVRLCSGIGKEKMLEIIGECESFLETQRPKWKTVGDDRVREEHAALEVSARCLHGLCNKYQHRVECCAFCAEHCINQPAA